MKPAGPTGRRSSGTPPPGELSKFLNANIPSTSSTVSPLPSPVATPMPRSVARPTTPRSASVGVASCSTLNCGCLPGFEHSGSRHCTLRKDTAEDGTLPSALRVVERRLTSRWAASRCDLNASRCPARSSVRSRADGCISTAHKPFAAFPSRRRRVAGGKNGK